ncbi:MAG: calcium/sodium antiporter [Pseudooceanicola sp.]|nr:calcium/sodium antiporter [Pseudooceanicola sp.]
MTFVLLGVGLVLLMAGGSLLVKGASDTALALGVSPLMIGLTLVGFGTSAPELVTSIQAALDGSPGIAVGNVVGSNICNVLLILGLAAVLSPIVTSAKSFRRDGLVLGLSALACLGVVLSGQAGRLAGVVLLGALVGYIWWAYRTEKEEPEEMALPVRLPLAVAIAAAGLVLVVLGARWLVQGAVDLASALGVSDTLIGLTIVAVGTSLPELVTSVMAAMRGQHSIAFGNVVGSNIYNVLGILGATALVVPVPIPPEIARFDIWVMLAATAALIVFAVTGWKVTRGEGAVFLGGYAAYCGWLVAGAM